MKSFKSWLLAIVICMTTIATTVICTESAEAQLFRSRRSNACCQPACAPVQNFAPVRMRIAAPQPACCGSNMAIAPAVTYAAPMIQSTMAPLMSAPMMSAPCCGSTMGSPMMSGQVIENPMIGGSIIGGQVIENSVMGSSVIGTVVGETIPSDAQSRETVATPSEGRPLILVDQSCLSKHATCTTNCAGCTGIDFTNCIAYCDCKKRNCPTGLENCGTPPLCYAGATNPPSGPGQ